MKSERSDGKTGQKNEDNVRIDNIPFLKLEMEESYMKKYVCSACGYIYDPEAGDPDSGIAPGTAFEDIPDDWVCPLCGVGKDMFEVSE